MLLNVKTVVSICDAIVDVLDSEMYVGKTIYTHTHIDERDFLVWQFLL